MAVAGVWTTCSWSGCGGVSSTRTSTCAATKGCRSWRRAGPVLPLLQRGAAAPGAGLPDARSGLPGGTKVAGYGVGRGGILSRPAGPQPL
jgi:hypothetical protein